jgi:aryl-alcohol dehydrogenase-like predicted oxidoreductase
LGNLEVSELGFGATGDKKEMIGKKIGETGITFFDTAEPRVPLPKS